MAKPKLCLIPAAQGDKFYSVLPSSGVGDFDFTRSGGATRINSQGLIETVADGVSRLNYPLIDGKVVGCPSHLLEPQSTNLLLNSDGGSSYGVFGSVNTVNQSISPNGTLNASLLEGNGQYNQIYLGTNTVNFLSGGDAVFSVFAKKGTSNYIYLFFNNYSGLINGSAYFDLENGVASNPFAEIEDYGNGWYRCSVVGTVASGDLSGNFAVRVASSLNSWDWSDTSGKNVYLYGFQAEKLPYKTSYIPTTNSAVTRSAETANNSGDASTFNDSEGVLMAEISALDDDLTNRRITISDNTTNNRIVLGFADTSNTILALVGSNGTQFISTISISDTKLNNKFALKYKQNDFALWVNGIEIATGTSGNTPLNLNNLKIQGSTGFSNFYGNTKQIQYYDSADIDLEKLTSWVSFSDMANGQLYSIQ